MHGNPIGICIGYVDQTMTSPRGRALGGTYLATSPLQGPAPKGKLSVPAPALPRCATGSATRAPSRMYTGQGPRRGEMWPWARARGAIIEVQGAGLNSGDPTRGPRDTAGAFRFSRAAVLVALLFCLRRPCFSAKPRAGEPCTTRRYLGMSCLPISTIMISY